MCIILLEKLEKKVQVLDIGFAYRSSFFINALILDFASSIKTVW